MTDKTTTENPYTGEDIRKAIGLGALYTKIEEACNTVQEAINLLTNNLYEEQATELESVYDQLDEVFKVISHDVLLMTIKKKE